MNTAQNYVLRHNVKVVNISKEAFCEFFNKLLLKRNLFRQYLIYPIKKENHSVDFDKYCSMDILSLLIEIISHNETGSKIIFTLNSFPYS